MDSRVKIVPVGRDLFVNVLNWMQNPNGQYLSLRHVDVPEDAKVEAVWWSEERRSFCALLSHKSFESIPEGEEAPVAYSETLAVAQRVNGTMKADMRAAEQLQKAQRDSDEKAAAAAHNWTVSLIENGIVKVRCGCGMWGSLIDLTSEEYSELLVCRAGRLWPDNGRVRIDTAKFSQPKHMAIFQTE